MRFRFIILDVGGRGMRLRIGGRVMPVLRARGVRGKGVWIGLRALRERHRLTALHQHLASLTPLTTASYNNNDLHQLIDRSFIRAISVPLSPCLITSFRSESKNQKSSANNNNDIILGLVPGEYRHGVSLRIITIPDTHNSESSI